MLTHGCKDFSPNKKNSQCTDTYSKQDKPRGTRSRTNRQCYLRWEEPLGQAFPGKEGDLVPGLPPDHSRHVKPSKKNSQQNRTATDLQQIERYCAISGSGCLTSPPREGGRLGLQPTSRPPRERLPGERTEGFPYWSHKPERPPGNGPGVAGHACLPHWSHRVRYWPVRTLKTKNNKQKTLNRTSNWFAGNGSEGDLKSPYGPPKCWPSQLQRCPLAWEDAQRSRLQTS